MLVSLLNSSDQNSSDCSFVFKDFQLVKLHQGVLNCDPKTEISVVADTIIIWGFYQLVQCAKQL